MAFKSVTTFVATKNSTTTESKEKKLSKIVKFEQEDGEFEIKKRFINAEDAEKKFPNQFVFVYIDEIIYGKIAHFHTNSYGEIMFLKQQDGVDLMVPLHTDLKYKLNDFQKDDEVYIKFLGRHPSPKNNGMTLFKFEVSPTPF